MDLPSALDLPTTIGIQDIHGISEQHFLLAFAESMIQHSDPPLSSLSVRHTIAPACWSASPAIRFKHPPRQRELGFGWSPPHALMGFAVTGRPFLPSDNGWPIPTELQIEWALTVLPSTTHRPAHPSACQMVILVRELESRTAQNTLIVGPGDRYLGRASVLRPWGFQKGNYLYTLAWPGYQDVNGT